MKVLIFGGFWVFLVYTGYSYVLEHTVLEQVDRLRTFYASTDEIAQDVARGAFPNVQP